jgi:hypothetical protein
MPKREINEISLLQQDLNMSSFIIDQLNNYASTRGEDGSSVSETVLALAFIGLVRYNNQQTEPLDPESEFLASLMEDFNLIIDKITNVPH